MLLMLDLPNVYYLGLSGLFDGSTPKLFNIIAGFICIGETKGFKKDLLGRPASSSND